MKDFLKQILGQRRRQISHLPDLKLDDLALIEDHVQKRLSCPLTKITDLIPGNYEKVRADNLKTEHGIVIKPIH